MDRKLHRSNVKPGFSPSVHFENTRGQFIGIFGTLPENRLDILPFFLTSQRITRIADILSTVPREEEALRHMVPIFLAISQIATARSVHLIDDIVPIDVHTYHEFELSHTPFGQIAPFSTGHVQHTPTPRRHSLDQSAFHIQIMEIA